MFTQNSRGIVPLSGMLQYRPPLLSYLNSYLVWSDSMRWPAYFLFLYLMPNSCTARVKDISLSLCIQSLCVILYCVYLYGLRCTISASCDMIPACINQYILTFTLWLIYSSIFACFLVHTCHYILGNKFDWYFVVFILLHWIFQVEVLDINYEVFGVWGW